MSLKDKIYENKSLFSPVKYSLVQINVVFATSLSEVQRRHLCSLFAGNNVVVPCNCCLLFLCTQNKCEMQSISLLSMAFMEHHGLLASHWLCIHESLTERVRVGLKSSLLILTTSVDYVHIFINRMNL